MKPLTRNGWITPTVDGLHPLSRSCSPAPRSARASSTASTTASRNPESHNFVTPTAIPTRKQNAMKHLLRIVAGAGVLALGTSLVACSTDIESSADADSYSVVFLAA